MATGTPSLSSNSMHKCAATTLVGAFLQHAVTSSSQVLLLPNDQHIHVFIAQFQALTPLGLDL